MQEGDKSTSLKIEFFQGSILYTPSPTYSKNIRSANATIANKIDFKNEILHKNDFFMLVCTI